MLVKTKTDPLRGKCSEVRPQRVTIEIFKYKFTVKNNQMNQKTGLET